MVVNEPTSVVSVPANQVDDAVATGIDVNPKHGPEATIERTLRQVLRWRVAAIDQTAG